MNSNLRKKEENERREKQQRPTCLLLKTLNFINQLILLLEYIEQHIYICKRLLLVLVVIGFLLVLGLLIIPNKY